MRLFHRPNLWAVALLSMIAAAASSSRPVLAQEPPTPPLDCGPLQILPGDFVAINVANVGRTRQGSAVVQLRVLDAAGAPLLDRSISLGLGQSRAVSVRSMEGGLMRGEVVAVSGPDELRLTATMQVPSRARSGGLTYGPHVVCSGPTANRGPV